MRIDRKLFFAASVSFLLLLAAAKIESADKMPAEKAGIISKPAGKIAFLRDKNVWMVDLDRQNQGKADAFQIISEVTNADGRLTWSPDNKQILYTRSGTVELKGPNMLGGKHKVYDIYAAFLDSAYANKRLFWLEITSNLGGRDPEWSAFTNKVLFFQDMNANVANSLFPNYQICTMNPDGSGIELLRKDWQNFDSSVMTIAPTMNKDGLLAFTVLTELRPLGLCVLRPNEYMTLRD
ncbi:MAG: TolB family protein, partial [Candidatus Zixiibacteriota bacterium]